MDERDGEHFRWTIEDGNLNVFQFEGNEIVWSKSYAQYYTAEIERIGDDEPEKADLRDVWEAQTETQGRAVAYAN